MTGFRPVIFSADSQPDIPGISTSVSNRSIFLDGSVRCELLPLRLMPQVLQCPMIPGNHGSFRAGYPGPRKGAQSSKDLSFSASASRLTLSFATAKHEI